MKRRQWIAFVAARYVSRSRGNSPSTVLSVLGIATGVLALTIIIAVMNGFQLGFIESILEISSYHLRVVSPSPDAEPELTGRLVSANGVLSVLPFREINVLLRRKASTRGALVRGVPPDALERDPGLAKQIEMEDGFFDLENPRNIIIGTELARHLSVWAGDEISLLSITGGIGNEGDDPNYRISGIFRSGFYEYDLGWAYINIDTAAELASVTGSSDILAAPIMGIKLKNRWQDRRAMDEIRKTLAFSGMEEGVSIESWRDYNRAFFSALRTEKLMMFILVGLIFIVVGLNIFQAQRRTVLERREEIGLLRALGASDIEARLVFVWDGFIIGFAGAGAGLVLGLLIAFHIPAFFSFLEAAVNILIDAVNLVSERLGGDAGAGEFAVFSPRIFI